MTFEAPNSFEARGHIPEPKNSYKIDFQECY